MKIADQAYRRLKDMIYRGRLQPGHRLVERDLAGRLGISRIPLRESLARLEAEGLVRSVDHAATYVEDFLPADVLEICSMRLLLEPLATRLAALRAGARQVKRLRQLCSHMTEHARSGDIAKLDLADYEFHRSIVHASKHHRLIRAYESSHVRVLSSRMSNTCIRTEPEATAAEHLQLVNCLEQRQPDLAQRVAYQHVEGAMRMIERAFGLQLDDIL